MSTRRKGYAMRRPEDPVWRAQVILALGVFTLALVLMAVMR